MTVWGKSGMAFAQGGVELGFEALVVFDESFLL